MKTRNPIHFAAILTATTVLMILTACKPAADTPDTADQPAPQGEPADLILKNAYVYTVDSERNVAEAVAIWDDTIVFVGSNAEVDPRPIARIDEAKVISLKENREGFRFVFKLVNLIGEPIAGNVAIIAALRPPHQPRFVSFPSMKLTDGMPVKLRKSVGYSISYFKEVTGRFYFPFSYSESFRILIYDRDEELVLDSTFLAEDVTVHGL